MLPVPIPLANSTTPIPRVVFGRYLAAIRRLLFPKLDAVTADHEGEAHGLVRPKKKPAEAGKEYARPPLREDACIA
jgi:hypothetical protein